MMHMIFVDNFVFTYCYTVLAVLLLRERLMSDLEALWP
jgi:hypothetical protein